MTHMIQFSLMAAGTLVAMVFAIRFFLLCGKLEQSWKNPAPE